MNYKEFKGLIDILRAGNKAVPQEDKVLIFMVQEAIKEVAKKTNPLVLVTPLHQDVNIIKKLEEGLYLREPKKIINDDSYIEIDDDLTQAVAHIVISQFSNSDNLLKHKKHASKFIMDYNWERLDSFGENPDLLSLSKQAVDFHGFKKFYIQKNKHINGYWFVWDMDFIKKLNSFLIQNQIEMSKSDTNNINLFISYADNNISIEHDDYEAIKELDKFLGEIEWQI